LSPDSPRPVIHVVAAAVIDAAGRVLIAQRPAGKHLAGGWEFPGGKLEPGEERVAGLARELREELGIAIETPRPLMRVRHAYPTREVLLDVWVVRRYAGEPAGLDGQALRWCAQEDLPAANLLPADAPIVAALRLPERLTQVFTPRYAVSDLRSLREQGAGAESAGRPPLDRRTRLRGVFCAGAEEAVAAARAGADFLVMRAALADGDLAVLCGSMAVPVYARGLEMEQAWALGATGLNEI
jgi:mutator protein MutT